MPNAEGRFALIIACNEFEDESLSRLEAPSQDAEALSRVLKDPAIGNFEVQTQFDLPFDKVNPEIEAFCCKRKPNDLLLLYFSTHGIKDEEGKLYFATPNTKLAALRTTTTPAALINDLMQSSPSRRQILLLDCCFSGAFPKGMTVKAKRVIDSVVGTNDYVGGRGRVVLTATDKFQYAFEGNEVKGTGILSVFTRILVRGLETGEADLDQDSQVSFDELCDYVDDQVVVESLGRQTPRCWKFEGAGKLFVAKNPNYRPSYDHIKKFIDERKGWSKFIKQASKVLVELDDLSPV